MTDVTFVPAQLAQAHVKQHCLLALHLLCVLYRSWVQALTAGTAPPQYYCFSTSTGVAIQSLVVRSSYDPGWQYSSHV